MKLWYGRESASVVTWSPGCVTYRECDPLPLPDHTSADLHWGVGFNCPRAQLKVLSSALLVVTKVLDLQWLEPRIAVAPTMHRTASCWEAVSQPKHSSTFKKQGWRSFIYSLWASFPSLTGLFWRSNEIIGVQVLCKSWSPICMGDIITITLSGKERQSFSEQITDL
jgi:hypothetical protein